MKLDKIHSNEDEDEDEDEDEENSEKVKFSEICVNEYMQLHKNIINLNGPWQNQCSQADITDITDITNITDITDSHYFNINITNTIYRALLERTCPVETSAIFCCELFKFLEDINAIINNANKSRMKLCPVYVPDMNRDALKIQSIMNATIPIISIGSNSERALIEYFHDKLANRITTDVLTSIVDSLYVNKESILHCISIIFYKKYEISLNKRDFICAIKVVPHEKRMILDRL